MNVVLITPTSQNISAFGIRSISAYLKTHGHQVRVILLPVQPRYHRDKKGILYGEFAYTESVQQQVIRLAAGSDLIGISLTTQYYECTAQLSDRLREETGTPVIWGGVHATVKPEQCLAHADMVCVGEGEETICELLDSFSHNKDWRDIANIGFLENGKLVQNKPRPLIQDLDSLPYLDYGPENHFILDMMSGEIVPFGNEEMELSLARVPYAKGKMLKSLMYFTTRGCPFSCSYCVNDFYRKLYGSKGYVRKQSVRRMIAELKSLVERFPFVEEIEFCDDNFALRSVDELADFAHMYKATINLPFQLLMSPTNITEEKIAPLVEAGLVFIETGIQSKAEISENLYKRKTEEESFNRAVKVLQKYQDHMAPPCYHLILDNPFESIDDTLKTFHFTLQLPRPFWFKRSSLVAFPGTEVYQQYLLKGLIHDEVSEIYTKVLEMPSTSYVNFLYFLNSQNYPRPLLRLLARKKLVMFLNTDGWVPLWGFIENVLRMTSKLSRWALILLRGDFASIKKRLKMIGKVKTGWLSSQPPAF